MCPRRICVCRGDGALAVIWAHNCDPIGRVQVGGCTAEVYTPTQSCTRPKWPCLALYDHVTLFGTVQFTEGAWMEHGRAATGGAVPVVRRVRCSTALAQAPSYRSFLTCGICDEQFSISLNESALQPPVPCSNQEQCHCGFSSTNWLILISSFRITAMMTADDKWSCSTCVCNMSFIALM